MAEVLLFHHVQGLTPGVVGFADELRTAGHVVHTPDLLDGNRFATLEQGVEYANQIGFDEIMARGLAAAEALPSRLVYAGISVGVMPAQQLTQTRAGAAGALFFEACLSPESLASEWPGSLPFQVHGNERDAWFADDGDLEAAQALVAAHPDHGELFRYPGEHHLLFDSSLPGFDPDSAAALTKRTIEFLDRVDD